MSSKNRKNQARNERRNQEYRSSHPGWPNRPPDANGAGRRGWKALIPLGAFLVIAGLVVYAVNATKSAKSGGSSSGTAAQSASPTPAAAPQPTPTGPRIKFANPVYEFGKVNGDELVNCLFLFTNVGNALLELTEVSPSCGCMKTGEWSHKVEPGRSGSISVQYDSHHYTGPFAKSVFVTCNDSNQPKVMLEIKGTVWRPVQLTPENAVMELNSEAPSNSTSVRILSNLDQPLTITNILNDNNAFAVELETNQPGKEYHLVVKTAAPFPTVMQQGHVTLKTTATNLPEISISTRANIVPLVMPIPYLIRMPPAPLTNPFPYTVWVRNNSTNHVTLSEPVVNASGVDVQLKEDPAGKQSTISLNFPAGFEVPFGDRVELTLKTSHPLVPVIKVPVVQLPRPAAEAPRPVRQGQ